MDQVFQDEIDCKRILREITLLRLLKNSYIVNMVEILEPTDRENFDELYVVLDLAESDLKKLIKSNTFLDIPQVRRIIYNILLSLKYLHSQQVQVIHRDLKPANVLVNEDCSVRICDFGLARSIRSLENTESVL